MTKALYSTFAAATLLLLAGCASSTDCCDLADAPADPRAHFAKFGTNKVHYVVEGKGKHAIVLVHCWSGNLGFWREQVPALTGKARVIRIDLPGHGQSDKPHTAYTMDFFAEAVLAVMKDAGVDKATLVGHSMGTPVICRVYKQAPERVAALVAVDGTLRRPPLTPEQTEQFNGFAASLNTPEYRQYVTNFIGMMFPIAGTEAIRDRVLSEMLETPQYVISGSMAGMFNADQPDWNPQHVNVPVLVISAPNPMWSDEYQAYVRSLSAQTDSRAIDGVGHWLMLEKPAEFNTALVEMLGKFGLIDK